MGRPLTEAMAGLEMGAGRRGRAWRIPALLRTPPRPDGTPPLDTLLTGWRWENCGSQAAGPTPPRSCSRGREKSAPCLAQYRCARKTVFGG